MDEVDVVDRVLRERLKIAILAFAILFGLKGACDRYCPVAPEDERVIREGWRWSTPKAPPMLGIVLGQGPAGTFSPRMIMLCATPVGGRCEYIDVDGSLRNAR